MRASRKFVETLEQLDVAIDVFEQADALAERAQFGNAGDPLRVNGRWRIDLDIVGIFPRRRRRLQKPQHRLPKRVSLMLTNAFFRMDLIVQLVLLIRVVVLGVDFGRAVSPRVLDGVASELPADSESFDVGVASLVLCSVPDQQTALRELHRVLRPGGELRFYEHMVADTPRFARAQRIADPLWTRCAGGGHLARDTAANIAADGFDIERVRRLTASPSALRSARSRPCSAAAPTSFSTTSVPATPRRPVE